MTKYLPYDKVLKITTEYLGPAAESFISRQVFLHLKKKPTELLKTDIPVLAIRMRSGLLVLTNDKFMVDEAFSRISAVADS